jgi:L-lysine 2,3-aminomutase
MKFGMRETDQLVRYIRHKNEITDLLITGGDPMIMSAHMLERYISPLLSGDMGALRNIRIGTKVLGYWPYKFLTDKDADDTLRLFDKIITKGFHMTIMAHFNHPQELRTTPVQHAIKRILSTGVQIRTQSPVMRHINDNDRIWAELWKEQVRLGCIPYYMFVARDTGAQEYFAITIARALEIYNKSTSGLSGITKTARGPVMSASIGKVEVVGIVEFNGEKLFCLRLQRARNPEWTGKLFFAKYSDCAYWLDELEPATEQDAVYFAQKYYACSEE